MRNLAVVSAIVATMSIGIASVSQAKENHASRSATQVENTDKMSMTDYQALAPTEPADRGLTRQDPLDYSLGYFRNF